MKWREKIGYYAKEIKKEMRETGRSTSGDFDSLEGFYADKEKLEEVLRIVNKNLEEGMPKGTDNKTIAIWLHDSMWDIKKILEK